MTQTAALFRDAYRALSAKKLFWIVLVLSGLVVAVFAMVGVTPEGISILWWELEAPINSKVLPPDKFYKAAFVTLGIKFWLAWIASILALVSTASIIPDFISSGAIELTLSKPIGRLRLFLTKYVAGLLFVTLQVAVFTAASFLVIGLRGGAWEPGLFWAVPYTVLFFSYLFSVCACLGLLTRSGVAALLLTLLAWFLIFGVHTAETTLMYFQERSAYQVESGTRQLESAERALAEALDRGEDAAARRTRVEDRAARLADVQARAGTLNAWHGYLFTAKTVLPKTSETIELLDRTLTVSADLENIDAPADSQAFGRNDPPVNEREVQKRVAERIRARSPLWVVGTSLLFEAAVVLLTAWVFARRDF